MGALEWCTYLSPKANEVILNHQHDHEVKVDIVDISTDVETVIDKVTESVLVVIAVHTVASILKKYL